MTQRSDPLQPLPTDFADLLDQAARYAKAYVAQTAEQSLRPADDALARLSQLAEPLPEAPQDPQDTLRALHELGSPTTIPTTGGRYFGFVNGGAHPAAVATRWLTDVWDQNAAFYIMSPIASTLEAVTERWLVDLLGLPKGTAAGFVSGTSTAMTSGFVAARNALLSRQGWDASKQGLFAAPPIRVVVGKHAHGSVAKALAFVGLGRDRVEVVPADAQGRMKVDRLPKLDDRTLLVAQAGNVNSGAFDPLDELCERARQAGAWVHIDGAFGLWAAASRTKKHLTRGFEHADSWAADAHKTLNAPYDCGIILCRDREQLARSMQASGSYLQTTAGQRDGSHLVPEMSRRARAIDVWAVLKTLGRRGVEQLIDQLCERAQSIAAGLQTAGFRVENEVVFNQVLVSCQSPELTRQTMAQIQSEGAIWCGGAIWHKQPVIRISVCSWATTQADVATLIAAFCSARSRASSATTAGVESAAEGQD